MTLGEIRAKDRAQVRAELRSALSPLKGIYAADRYDHDINIGKLRRAGRSLYPDPTRSLTLLEDENGVLLWEDGAVIARPVAGFRRGFRGVGASGDVVEHVLVEALDPSKVGEQLESFDRRFTPKPGLRQIANGVLGEPDENLKPVQRGRILLFIHGTFSETKAILDQLQDAANPAGNRLLKNHAQNYDQVLAFDHPTLCVSPMLNALDLARRLKETQADIDVICHSRGGLVARWWLEAFDRPVGKRRVVLVGCPLAGTSLASPPRLRTVMSWLTNLNKVIGAATSMIPFMQVVSCLARLTATVTSLMVDTPLIDAAVALVPGLAGMSLTENNFELNRLNGTRAKTVGYHVIKSQFQPNDPGWKFWEYFVDQPLQRAAHSLFPGANDLVVDMGSMAVVEKTLLGGNRSNIVEIAPANIHDFGTTNTIFHTNYFRQAKTAEKIMEWLQPDGGGGTSGMKGTK